jgi:hypothetical protein
VQVSPIAVGEKSSEVGGQQEEKNTPQPHQLIKNVVRRGTASR